MNKKESLTIDEQIKYHQLRLEHNDLDYSILLLPFYTYSYLGIFVLIMRYAFTIELSKPILIICQKISSLWGLIVLIYMFIWTLGYIRIRNHNKRIKERIISERKKVGMTK